MEHINHFNQKLISFDIDGNFQYKPLLAEDELEMDISFCYIDLNGISTFDVRRFNVLRLAHNLKVVPYSIETIKEVTGKEIGWPELVIQDRIKLLLKISTSVFEKILKQADKADYGNLELKKKSKD